MLSYSTTNILKLSAAVYLNFENKIFVDLNLFLKNYMNPYMGIGLWCWGVTVKVVLKLSDKLCNIVTIFLLKSPIETKLYELFNALNNS